jgi:hypothetical protein
MQMKEEKMTLHLLTTDCQHSLYGKFIDIILRFVNKNSKHKNKMIAINTLANFRVDK